MTHPNGRSIAEQAKALVFPSAASPSEVSIESAKVLASLEVARQLGRVAEAMEHQANAQHRIVEAIRKRI